jgi:hypothetical protein
MGGLFDFCLFCDRFSHCSQAALELTMKPRLASNSQSSCLSLLSSCITTVLHHTQKQFYILLRRRFSKFKSVYKLPSYICILIILNYDMKISNLIKRVFKLRYQK